MMAGVNQRIREMLAQDPRAVVPGAATGEAKSRAVPDASGGGFVMSDDEFIGGTPTEVAEQIIQQCQEVGAGNFLSVLHWGASLEEVARGHELFGQKVLPSLKSANMKR